MELGKNGENIQTFIKNNSKAQRFFIMNYNGAYRIVSDSAPDLKALDLNNGAIANNNNIQLYEAGSLNNNAQTWKFEIIEERQEGIEYSTHVQNIGWQGYVANGALAGTSGKGLQIEAIKIRANTNYSGNVEYSAHVQNIGWQNFVSNGNIAGTVGSSLRVEAIKIKLTGEIANHYDIYYRVHTQNIGWLDWAKNGEEAGTLDCGFRLEGIEIKLVSKGTGAPGSTNTPFKEKKELAILHIYKI